MRRPRNPPPPPAPPPAVPPGGAPGGRFEPPVGGRLLLPPLPPLPGRVVLAIESAFLLGQPTHKRADRLTCDTYRTSLGRDLITSPTSFPHILLAWGA